MKKIAIVCENNNDIAVYIHAANAIVKSSKAEINIIENPAADKSSHDSIIFVFDNDVSDSCALLNSWVGHQHIVTVAGKKLEQKLSDFAQVFRHVAGIPEFLEIERKYLIHYPNIDLLEQMPNCCAVSISQTYLDIPARNVRLRCRTVDGKITYIKTEKSKLSDISRIEIESEISREEYERLLQYKRRDMATIDKTRYCLMHNGNYFEIDVFPFWSDKAYAEIELISEDETVELPPFFKLIKEVTQDKRYTNKSLAKLIADNQLNTLQD